MAEQTTLWPTQSEPDPPRRPADPLRDQADVLRAALRQQPHGLNRHRVVAGGEASYDAAYVYQAKRPQPWGKLEWETVRGFDTVAEAIDWLNAPIHQREW